MRCLLVMIRLIPSGNPRGLGLGYVRGGVHMLLILSPIVQSGGLIDNALAPHDIYYKGILSISQDIMPLHK